jgi:nucleoside-diphosphate-sugar epimerase
MSGRNCAGGPLGPILITGARGFLGAWLTAELLKRGEAVWAFDINEDRSLLAELVGAEKAASVGWTVGDITDRAAIDRAFEAAGARAVVHLAALTIPSCREDPARAVAVNLIGHINVLEAAHARGLENILYTSSAAAHPRGPLRTPANIYGVTKRAVEDISKVYFLDHGITSVGLRPNVVYGYGRTMGETAAISEAIRAAAEGRPYAMPYASQMCFQYVGEVVDVMLRCLDACPKSAIVSDITTEQETIDDVVAAILQMEPAARITRSQLQRPSPNVPLDNAPLKSLIGEWPHVPLEEGVQATFRHYRRRPDAMT